MAMPFNPPRQGKGYEEPTVPTTNLWVGNLAGETVDSDLVELFGPYGQLDNVSTYTARSFAFVFFKSVENAKAAKEALQGATVHGNQIKIEFARPGKPCKSLWVGGIGPAVSKEEVEKEFSEFGKIEDFRFLKDRNTAFVDYYTVEDASQALRNMNGKQIGGNRIRVDFLRSHISRREQWPGSQDSKDGLIATRMDGNFPAKRLHSQSGDWKRDDQPSNILCVFYPPSLQIDEQMLHNAMILFGEIEKIKSFPARQCSFVEFRSVEEARHAKEGLQGRLFNDPRITIMYSSNELAKDSPGPSPHAKGLRPDMYLNEPQFRTSQMDMLGQHHSGIPGMSSGKLPSGMLGQPMRPLVPQGSLEPLLSGPEYGDLASLGQNWRRAFPIPPAQGVRPSLVQTSGPWGVYDASQLPRDAKHPRIEASLPADDAGFPLRKVDDLGPGLERSYYLGPTNDAIIQGKGHLTTDRRRSAIIDDDCIWHGIIAKGGTPVCHARCILFGERMEVQLPRVVNCSARTGLDVLAKHRAEAIGYDVVYFLPDSEDDFASYTEFLCYLGSKNRAGVAKFDDGTTMFLVPPSDFLRKDLNVMGPERLYGVVLKLAPTSPSHAAVQQYQPLPSQTDYTVTLPQVKEQTFQMDLSSTMPEDQKPPQRPLEQSTLPNQPPTLTPELIASLTSLLPVALQPAPLSGSQRPSLSSTAHYTLTQTIPQGRVGSHGWNQEQLASDPAIYSFQQPGNQINSTAQLPTLQQYASVSGIPTHFAQMAHSSFQFQESIVGLAQQGVQTSRPVSNFTMPSQSAHSEHIALGASVGQLDVPLNTIKGYGIVHGADASGLYISSALQQTGDHNPVSNLVHGINFCQPLNTMQPSADKVNMEIPTQVQHVQSMPSETALGKSDVEVDKIQRYQSTIEYATNLLRQIQKQQCPNTSGQGTGSQP